MDKVTRFYSDGYDEDSRLHRHGIEFATTTYVLDKVVGSESQVLDVGAGTGRYSVYYADRGCSVTALDLVPKHIEILDARLRAMPSLQVSALVGDARDLSRFQDGTFDVVLCMGPIYHLKADETDGCVRESLRVLRTHGVLAASYVNRYDGYESDRHRGVFTFHAPGDIDQLLREHGIDSVCNVPTDGAPFDDLGDLIVNRHGDLQESHVWLERHQSVFNRVTGRSVHGLCVGRKGS